MYIKPRKLQTEMLIIGVVALLVLTAVQAISSESVRVASGVAENPVVQDIKLFGNLVTRDHILLRELRIKIGDTYTASDIALARKNLEKLEFIDYADIMEKRVTGNMVVLVVQVEEISKIDWHLFSDFDRLPRHINYIGGVGAAKHNFRGRGEFLELSSGLPWNNAAQIHWSSPWFLGLPRVGFFVEGYWQRFDYEVRPLRLTDYGAETGLYYSLVEGLDVRVGYHYRKLKTDRALDRSLEGKRTDPALHLGIKLDLRDDKYYPHNGVLARFDLHHAGLGQTDRYNVYSGQIAGFFKVPYLGVLGGRAIYRGGNKKLPYYQRNYLGGIYDMRGYAVGQMQGDNAVLATIELRHPIITLPLGDDEQLNLGVHVFNDWGKTWEHNQKYLDNDFLYTWGIGFHTQFRQGNFRFEWTWSETGYEQFVFGDAWTF